MRMLKVDNRPFYNSLPTELVFVDYLRLDNNWADAETIFWFEIGFAEDDDVEYETIGIVWDGTWYTNILDHEGYPIENGWIDRHADELCDLVTDDMKRP